jgi:hypothetical protein
VGSSSVSGQPASGGRKAIWIGLRNLLLDANRPDEKGGADIGESMGDDGANDRGRNQDETQHGRAPSTGRYWGISSMSSEPPAETKADRPAQAGGRIDKVIPKFQAAGGIFRRPFSLRESLSRRINPYRRGRVSKTPHLPTTQLTGLAGDCSRGPFVTPAARFTPPYPRATTLDRLAKQAVRPGNYPVFPFATGVVEAHQ